jgi:competence protein ComEA
MGFFHLITASKFRFYCRYYIVFYLLNCFLPLSIIFFCTILIYMNPLFQWLRNYFGLSSRETKALLLLFPLMVTLLLIQYIPGYLRKVDSRDLESDRQLLDSLSQTVQLQSQVEKGLKEGPATVPLHYYKTFDPNRATASELIEMGMSKSLATRWENYLSKGGKFRQVEDVKKLYGMSEAQFQALAPYMVISTPRNPESSRATSKPDYSSEKKEKRVVALFDLNLADTIQLKSVYGIGPVLAGRIIDRRGKLGGFIQWEQLEEIYGLSVDVIERLQAKSYISEDFSPQKIYLNRANKEELAAHPYVSFRMAQAIITYRQQHGAYRSVDDLYKIHSLDTLALKKLKPYLQWE